MGEGEMGEGERDSEVMMMALRHALFPHCEGKHDFIPSNVALEVYISNQV